MGNTPTVPVSAAPPSDVWASAFAESQAGRPASTNAKGTDVFANAFQDSVAGRPPMADATATPTPSDDTGLWAGVKRNTYGMVSGLYHAFRDPATQEETADLARKVTERNIAAGTLDPKDPNHIPESLASNPSTTTLAYHRLVDAPADELNKKGDNELAAARDLYDNQHKWEGVSRSVSGATDKVLAAVPMLGPYINSIADRWEKGDHIGALTDMAAAVALENAHAKITGEPAPAPNWVGKTTEAIAKPVGEIAGKATSNLTGIKLSPSPPPNPFLTDDVVAARAAKSGLPAGAPETVAPTGENIRPDLHQGVRDFVNKTNTESGLPPAPKTASVLDIAQQQADAFQARSQTAFDQVEKITGVNPTTLKQIMATRADQIESYLAAGKDEEAGALKQLQLNDENRMAKAFTDAKTANPTADFEQARSDWNKSLRADEFSNAVRSSKSSTSTLANPEIDPSKFTTRVQKLYESQPGGKTAKLVQLGGDANAKTLVESVENARGAEQEIKEFKPTSATGQKAMQDILRPNTGSRLVGSGMKTNFLKSLDNFEKLTSAEQAVRFPGAGEVEQARAYLKSQARWQVGKRIAAGIGIAAIASGLGVTGAVVHALME